MEETIKNILKRLDNLEFRVSSLEKEKNKVVMRRPVKKKVSGVVGGIYELIDAGFLKEPKLLNEIDQELKHRGYYYPLSSISRALLRDFMRRKDILTRIGKRREWRYVIKK